MKFGYFELLGLIAVLIGFLMNSVLVFCIGFALGLAGEFFKIIAYYRSGAGGRFGVSVDLLLLLLIALFFVGFVMKNEGLAGFAYKVILGFVVLSFLSLFFRVITSGLKKRER